MSGRFHFDCVFYFVSDLDRSIRFYQQTLGFEMTSRDEVARFNVDGALFELVPTNALEKLSGQGNARLALRVDDIDSAVSLLRERGVPATSPENKGTGVISYLRDPDGNEICLWQYL